MYHTCYVVLTLSELVKIVFGRLKLYKDIHFKYFIKIADL